MNKVYRVVWNARLGVWMAVSELAKSTTKNTKFIFTSASSMSDASSNRPFVSTLFFTSRLLPSLVGLVMGTSLLLSTTQAIAVPGVDSLAAGVGAESTGAQSLAAGVNALSSGERSLAAGVGAVSSGDNSLAAGVDAISSGNFSLAVGSGVESEGTTSVAIGFGSESKAASSLAIGQFAESLGTSSIAIGQLAQSSGANSVAIGQFAQASADNSVALGQGSVADGSTLSTAAYQPIDADGNAIPITLGTATSEVNIGDRRITGVAAGATDSDAVNVSQLKAVNTNVITNTNTITAAQNQLNQGLTLSLNGDARTYQLGDTIGVTTDSNLLTTTTAEGANLALNPNLNLGSTGSVTTGTTVLNSNGLSISGGPSITAQGMNAGNLTITNVADGIEQTDAATVGQIASAVAAGKTEVSAGTNIADILTTTGDNGQTVYTINANGTKASAGSAALEVTTSTPDANNVTDYAIDLSQDTKTSLVKAENSVQYDNPTKTSVTLGGAEATIPVTLTNVAPASLSATSTDAVNGSQLFDTNNTITAAQNQLNQGLTLSLNGDTRTYQLGDTIGVTTDSNLLTTTTAEGANLALNPNLNLGSTGSVTTGATVLNSNGLSISGGPSITAQGMNAGNLTITNVADGDVSEASKETVNGGQLYSLGNTVTNIFGGNAEYSNNTISWNNIGGTGQNTLDGSIAYINNQVASANQGWTVTTDSGSAATSTVKPGDNVSIKGDAAGGITVTNNAKDISIGLGSQITIGNGDNAVSINGDTGSINVGKVDIDGVTGNMTAGQVAINGEKGTVNGLTNTTWNSDSIVSGQAATEDQLQQVVRDAETAVTAAKSTVSSGSNITVTPTQKTDGSYDYQVATQKEVSFDTVQVGKVSVNASGVDAGGTKVSNIADGAINSTSKDSVNGSQLYKSNADIYSYFGGGATYETNTGPTYDIHGESLNNVGDALNALDNRDNQLNNKITNLGDQFQQISYVTNERIDNVEKNANAGIAAAIALETAPYVAGKYTYAAAAAYHGGENALGISLRKTADNGRWSLTGGVAAASQGDPSVRIGISGVID